MNQTIGPEWRDAVVVGGGIGGLVAAYTLAAQGLHVVVLEATGRAGGLVQGGTFPSLPDVPVDLGAESFAVRGGAVGPLVEELGLTVEAPAHLTAWGYASGQAFPLPAAGVLGIPSRPWARDVRHAVGWAGVLRGALDRILPAWRVDTTNLETLVRTRLGSRVTDRLVTPIATGVHSAPLDRLDVATVAPGLLEAYSQTGSLSRAVTTLRAAAPAGSAVQGIDGGIHRLTHTLVNRLDVRYGARVVEVLRGRGGADWCARTEDGREFRSPRLVLATPTEIGSLHPNLGVPPTPERGADIRLVTLLVEAPELDVAPRGSGMLVAPGARTDSVRAKALTHATAKWPWLAQRVREAAGPGWHVVRLSYGRIGEPTPHPTTQDATRDASELFGVDLNGRVQDSLHQRWGGGLPPPTPTYRASIKRLEEAVHTENGLDVTGGWIAGSGLAAIIGHARHTTKRLESGF